MALPTGHVLEIWEDVARMGEDAAGTEWAEACILGGMPSDLVMHETVLLIISWT